MRDGTPRERNTQKGIHMEEWRLPEAFEARMRQHLGQEYEEFLFCYENDKYQALRLNPLKKGLQEGGTPYIKDVCKEPVPWAKDAFYYDKEERPGKHPYHEMGVYYIQEPSAMSAAAVLAPKPGMRVLDLCAAPGGKTTQLASYLMQQGLLVANEIHPARAKILSTNVERMGITNGIVTNEDSGTLADHFGCYFHAILVDSPCSGEGMFRKNPEAMEEWSPENVELCAARSEEILDNAARMLLPGGTLVYSTCTFAPEENEQEIANFLAKHEEFSLVSVDFPQFEKGRWEWLKEEQQKETVASEIEKTMRLWPHKLHGEGHFVACLKKAGQLPDYESGNTKNPSPNTNQTEAKRSNTKQPDAAQRKALEEFVNAALSQELADWIVQGNLIMFGDQLYRLPGEAPSLRGIHVLRAGTHIGEFKKNRLEPSHALALAMGEEDARSVVHLSGDDARTRAFFRGESLCVDREQVQGADKGWCLVCVDHMSAGWGKLSNLQVKNHYPKGLRRELG